MDVLRACEEFLRYCETVRQLSPHTIRAYRLDLERFAGFAGEATPVREIDRSRLHDFVEALFGAFSLKATSAKRHIASVKGLFRWLEEEGHLDSPFRHARIKIKLPKRLPRVLTREELRALLAEPGATTFDELTGQLAVELLFCTGVRVAELAHLEDVDIDLAGGVITITGKGDRQRRVYLTDAAVVDLLRAYRQARATRAGSQTRLLLTSRGTPVSPDAIRRLVRERAASAKLSRRITPHMFRHSCATYLLEEGLDIRYVQRLLGHRSISTTELYTHVTDAALKARLQEHQPRRSILRN